MCKKCMNIPCLVDKCHICFNVNISEKIIANYKNKLISYEIQKVEIISKCQGKMNLQLQYIIKLK